MLLVWLLVVLASLEFIPLLLALFCGINYGATRIGRFQQFLNETVSLYYISWLAFDVLLVLLLRAVWSQCVGLSIWHRFVFTAVILTIAYLSVYAFLHLCNLVFSLAFSNPPFLAARHLHFPEATRIEQGCRDIQREFWDADIATPCIHDTVPGFQVSTPRMTNCWRTIVLKKQGQLTAVALDTYPVTARLIRHPTIHNALFSILDGNVNIPPHTGYYKGYLRYHLGVEVPEDGGRKAFIVCGKERYEWKTCEGVLFDDMFSHHVANPTPMRRVVLYLDVLRRDVPWVLRPLYHACNWYIETHVLLKHLVKVQHAQTADSTRAVIKRREMVVTT
jgi:aspartyl/asparaginyl beta-hydroxylase (cupin superfamily)